MTDGACISPPANAVCTVGTVLLGANKGEENMAVAKSLVDSSESWPALPLDAWADTYATLHMWTQIVGKVRLGLAPRVNHWWEVPLYVNARGLTTSPIPYSKSVFEIQFDFIDHR